MSSYALFRLPRQQYCTLVEQHSDEPQHLRSVADIGEQEGFVLAPFHSDDTHPILLLKPERVIQLSLNDEAGIMSLADRLDNNVEKHAEPADDSAEGEQAYAADFSVFHQALTGRRFRKLVLARRADIANDGSSTPQQLFLQACRRYPRMFVALVSTPQSGTWLAATPEILLEGTDGTWRTIALAGTMRLTDGELDGEGEHKAWDVKDIQEQRIVASYIADTLKRQGIEYTEDGPHTVRAAHLVHLRSDFTFRMDNNRVGQLLEALHPTPAVCGLPKDAAMQFILANEHTRRSYYCGFMGPVNMLPTGSCLYVSLRCMQIKARSYRLFAGGGLLPESDCRKEWNETEAKMETMLNLIS